MNPAEVKTALRQMLAVLEDERQALAALDLDGIVGASGSKERLCGTLDAAGPFQPDEETRAMLEAARRLNEVNRQVRNLIAANVASRLDTLTGRPETYEMRGRYAVARHRADCRALFNVPAPFGTTLAEGFPGYHRAGSLPWANTVLRPRQPPVSKASRSAPRLRGPPRPQASISST